MKKLTAIFLFVLTVDFSAPRFFLAFCWLIDTTRQSLASIDLLKIFTGPYSTQKAGLSMSNSKKDAISIEKFLMAGVLQGLFTINAARYVDPKR